MSKRRILRYLAAFPGLDSVSIAHGLSIGVKTVRVSLSQHRKEGAVMVVGTSPARGTPRQHWDLTDKGYRLLAEADAPKLPKPAPFRSKAKYGPPKSLFLRAQMDALNEQIEAMEERMPLNPTPPDIHQAIASQPAVFHAWANLREAA